MRNSSASKDSRSFVCARLERLIRPSGYFRQKANRLKTFVAFLDKQYSGSLDQLFAQPTDQTSRRAFQLEWRGPGDRRLDSAVCRKSSGFCGRCLHAPHPRTSWNPAGENGLRRHSGVISACLGRDSCNSDEQDPTYPLRSTTRSRLPRSRTSSLRNEHVAPHGFGAGLQRNARSHRGSRKEPLQEITAQM